ncbi:hypothetical protein Hanom_Chr04g00373751 [Helianthus anomalus]
MLNQRRRNLDPKPRSRTQVTQFRATLLLIRSSRELITRIQKPRPQHEADEFIINSNIWSDWFDSLDLWVRQSIPFEGVAWIKFHGVPLHLAE